MSSSSSSLQFWASLGNKQVGPCETRAEAVVIFRETFPVKKPNPSHELTTGYGAFGPHFDIRWIKRHPKDKTFA